MRYITATEAAKRLGITRNWLYTLIAMGKVKAIVGDDAWRWKVEKRSVDEYLFRKQEAR